MLPWAQAPGRYTEHMDKTAERAGHDLMLTRIEEGLKEEDRSNARAWMGKSDAQSARAIAQCSDLGDALVRSRGFPIEYGPLEFPPLPRK